MSSGLLTNDQFVEPREVRVFVIEGITEAPGVVTAIDKLLLTFRVHLDLLIVRVYDCKRRAAMSRPQTLRMLSFF